MRFIYRNPFVLAAGLLLLAAACGETSPAEDASATVAIEPEPRIEMTLAPAGRQAGETVQAWVDQLNIREKPDTKAKKVASARKGEALTFTGEQTDKTETIVLRGIAYDEPWLKVRTKDKLEGWVFSGAVKGEGEMKGNAIIDDLHFNFPAFGNFDLSKWQEISSVNTEGGDAETTTKRYQKADQLLEISATDVGEYGYTRTYKLLDLAANIMKERNFSFEVDSELRITETVTDYTNTPPIRYTRSQPMKLHFMQLNELPLMAAGKWTESELEE